ncbi:MAG: efflux RND transporter periplasmic adaptor subunit [Planctomycetota bacterium]|nr:efflux RND transporter periplasmic adaptor subunit [Planctomycetota bacterium]
MSSISQSATADRRSVHDLASSGGRETTIPVPRARWMTRLGLPLAIVLAAAGMLIYASWERLMPASPVRVVPVVLKTVQGQQQQGSVTVQAPGWVEPDPHPYYASALTDGIVESILVLEGDEVSVGQVVARMVDDDARLALAQAEATLEQKRGELEAAQADLKAAQRDLEHLVARRRAVAVAEAKVAEIAAERDTLEADLLVEHARRGEIADELNRKRGLIDSGAASEATIRRLELRLDAQAATIKATEKRRDVLTAQQQQAEADLNAARRNLELLIEEQRALDLAKARVRQAESAVRLAEATRDTAKLRLDRMLVRAPVGGVVMVRLASPGSKLVIDGPEHSAHVVHIYDPQRLQVRVDVPLADAASVGVGQEAEIIVEVLPDRVFRGRVTRIVNEADIAKNTVEVKVEIDDPISALKPQMLARVRFLATVEPETGEEALRQRVFAPADVLASAGDESTADVLVIGRLRADRGRVEQRSITLGPTVVDGWREVTDGLRPGDLLVMNAPAGLEAGDRVRVLGETNLQPQLGGL